MKATVIYPADRRPPVSYSLQTPLFAKEEQTLDWLFRQCNRVDGTEWIADRPYRSMSVDDIVVLETGSVYVCAMVGWEKIN